MHVRAVQYSSIDSALETRTKDMRHVTLKQIAIIWKTNDKLPSQFAILPDYDQQVRQRTKMCWVTELIVT